LRNRTIVFAQSGVAKLADRRRIDLAITPACSAGGLLILKLRPRTCIGKRQIHENRFAIDANGKYGQQSPGTLGHRSRRRRDSRGVRSRSLRVRRERLVLRQTSVLGKAGAIQQSAYPSSPGKWHVHLALENSRINTGNTGIFFRVKAESHYQGFTQPPT